MKERPEALYWECYARHIRIDYQAWVYFYWRLVHQYTRFQEFDVLDFGCGTGLSALLWKTLPYVNGVVGVENDQSEQKVAKFRGIETHSSIAAVQKRYKRFPAVVSHNDVPNHIHPQFFVRDFTRPVYRMLRKGGVLVFDFLTPEKYVVAKVKPIQFGEWKIMQRPLRDDSGFKRIQVQFFYNNLLVKSVIEWLFPQGFITERLTSAGFTHIYFHCLLDEKPIKTVNSNATRLVCVAVK